MPHTLEHKFEFHKRTCLYTGTVMILAANFWSVPAQQGAGLYVDLVAEVVGEVRPPFQSRVAAITGLQ